ncbi:MogA/MoaB family molybdenum cofactor biosynthesis protein [Corynebacterium sp. 153RC1]|uniref:MogA/MoaB family molybdenum cofactor biosynthesis protein n=1 Tax=Corynebacterium TaxID=1716 RepID=UPI00211C34C4|nr:MULTISPECIES: MogA/MoaB family molybdenum cofactor biosynthesis protein [unclassified Corynebacterium]MCQ9371063.1 MogA/MoaB family molybdenum cofactor biosynthesis protein [Corynebacterium sp. 35RC1]MCQ9343908.1 MogA/MoaB family molybdenum cofactor biosynthesis protein [Corynebacterium sp. 76QC2CO]MCQ9352580.1 MogA/MoaB family molybdenum cofactor biosynthesis protein [Corynebacterium sp. 209RC1]MCQ9354764.1 MogA/MoaB family molybdenum cofactor biosynthesis protein [Corynebacterium sp. 1222R
MSHPFIGALEDSIEPDEAFFLASEAEGAAPPPRRALVVLISDHTIGSGEDTDRLCTELLTEGGFVVDGVLAVHKSRSKIRQAIETAVVGGVDLVLTVGGTGVGPRDKTPEATRDVLDQDVPGVAQAIRASGLACGAVDAGTSRGISGISGSTVIINLADSRAAIRDGMATLTPLVHHLIDQLRRAEVQA